MITTDSLLEGMSRNEFFLKYLPTVSLADGRCTGAEALVRWRRPAGVLQPMDFIPSAENTPVVGLLTYWVFDTVAAELGAWLRAHPGAHISINVPPEILGRGGLLYAAQKSGLSEFTSQIILEITERGVPDAMGVEAMNLANTLGVRVALDDVTLTGGANLAIWARTSFHVIKLDRSLVAQIAADMPRPDWLGGIAALVQSSKLLAIAEGVETQLQRTTLREAKIQEAQGFLFSPPLSAERFIGYHGASPDAVAKQVLPQSGDG